MKQKKFIPSQLQAPDTKKHMKNRLEELEKDFLAKKISEQDLKALSKKFQQQK